MKPIILILLITYLLIFGLACLKENHVVVRIEVLKKEAIDFEKYTMIGFNDLTVDHSLGDSFDPTQKIQDFFSGDVSKTFNLPVHLKPTDTSFFEEKQSFTEEIKLLGNALFLTGKIELKVKKRSVIKDEKDESGKKKKQFVSIQHWDMNVEYLLIDCQSGETVYKKVITEKLIDADPETIDYNFETLFLKTGNQFVRTMVRSKSDERRNLLLKN